MAEGTRGEEERGRKRERVSEKTKTLKWTECGEREGRMEGWGKGGDRK